jgi:diadenosine tetraphosphate (Ap4A) HIT family hydrolase
MAADYIERMSCAFCDAASTTGEIVFEDETAWVILHDDWSVRGHAMVAAKQHVENFSDLGNPAAFTAIWQETERVLLELTGCERAIVMKLGIATPHLHVHIYPVHATATREEVFAAIDGKTRVDRDAGFVSAVRESLTAASR